VKRLVAWLPVLLLAACDGPRQPEGPAVVVYASEDDPAGLQQLLSDFTDDTGIPVSLEWGDSSENTDRLIEKSGRPADVLITDNAVDIWRAAEEGALRPITSGALTAVDPHLRDPDKYWAALQRRFIVIAVSPAATFQSSGGYDDLGAESYNGQLCLSSVENSVNRALIAMLIEDLGLKPAERLVRAWMMNLQVPPFATEQQLLAALESGDCEYGVVSDYLVPGETMQKIGPVPLYADISAVGVGRHAGQPERAQQLVDWIRREHPPEGLAEWNGRNIGLVGARDEDVRKLAERVGYR
jgi:iron(III) transport system substrate-binding protein